MSGKKNLSYDLMMIFSLSLSLSYPFIDSNSLTCMYPWYPFYPCSFAFDMLDLFFHEQWTFEARTLWHIFANAKHQTQNLNSKICFYFICTHISRHWRLVSNSAMKTIRNFSHDVQGIYDLELNLDVNQQITNNNIGPISRCSSRTLSTHYIEYYPTKNNITKSDQMEMHWASCVLMFCVSFCVCIHAQIKTQNVYPSKYTQDIRDFRVGGEKANK